MLIVRELTGGLYFGERREPHDGPDGRQAYDTLLYTEPEVAPHRRASPSSWPAAAASASRAWTRPTCSPRAGCGAPSSRRSRRSSRTSTLEHRLVDSGAMSLITKPGRVRRHRHREHVRRHPLRRGLGAGGLAGHAALRLARRAAHGARRARASTSPSTARRRPRPAWTSPTRAATILSAAMMLRWSLGQAGGRRGHRGRGARRRSRAAPARPTSWASTARPAAGVASAPLPSPSAVRARRVRDDRPRERCGAAA